MTLCWSNLGLFVCPKYGKKDISEHHSIFYLLADFHCVQPSSYWHTLLTYTLIECIIVVGVMNVDIREMRIRMGATQSEFAARYNIPYRTIQNWETGMRKPPQYIMDLLESRMKSDLVNRKATLLPEYDPRKRDLPRRSDYVGAASWLKAVLECIGEPFVFALDQALMCQGNFGGRSDEFLVWGYGNDSALCFNGVILLGNRISRYSIQEKNGLLFTDFNRTVADALANESILDMQGITEALSRYYYRNGESFEGVSIVPEYQERFERLAEEAIGYYEN